MRCFSPSSSLLRLFHKTFCMTRPFAWQDIADKYSPRCLYLGKFLLLIRPVRLIAAVVKHTHAAALVKSSCSAHRIIHITFTSPRQKLLQQMPVNMQMRRLLLQTSSCNYSAVSQVWFIESAIYEDGMA